jgi:hypothetical protein
MLSAYQDQMIASLVDLRVQPSALAGAVLLALTAALSGCADMSDSMTSAFADPAKYDLYNCKQLETERKNLAIRMTELQGLMNKAQSGFGGPVVSEVAYRNDYMAIRGQSKNAEAAWVANKCHETQPATPAPAAAPVAPSARSSMKSGSAAY